MVMCCLQVSSGHTHALVGRGYRRHEHLMEGTLLLLQHSGQQQVLVLCAPTKSKQAALGVLRVSCEFEERPYCFCMATGPALHTAQALMPLKRTWFWLSEAMMFSLVETGLGMSRNEAACNG